MRDAIGVTTGLPSLSHGVGTPVRSWTLLGALLWSKCLIMGLGGEFSSAVK